MYHVDSIVFDGKLQFAKASRYRMPPMSVAHEGGIFVTSTIRDDDPRATALREMNDRVLTSFGLRRGASHTEFIHALDGNWYFLETSARVGGAYIVDVVEAASGLNLWREWAAAEIAGEEGYQPPADRGWEAGIVLSLARQEWPDLSAYQDPEIVARIKRAHHAGLVLAAEQHGRVPQLLDDYVARFQTDFHASAPPPERPLD